jgi:hypothetical protein
VKSGWRVRKARARRSERLLQDFVGFPEPEACSGPRWSTAGSACGTEKTQQTCGLGRMDRVGRVFEGKSSWREHTQGNPNQSTQETPERGGDGVPHADLLIHEDHEDHEDQPSNGAAFSGPHSPGGPGPSGPPPRICEHCVRFKRDISPRRSHWCRLGGLCLTQRQGGECGPSGALWAAR